MVDFKAALLASLEKHKDVMATDVDTVTDVVKKEGTTLSVGLHEGCEITSIEVGEEAADKQGSLCLKGDATFQRCFITFSKDGKEKKMFFAIPTEKLGYGINGTLGFYVKLKQLFQAAHGVEIHKEIAIKIFKIFLDNPSLLLGAKVDVTVGFGNVSYVDYVDKGVWQIVEWRAKDKVHEVIEDLYFKDLDEAKTYALKNDITLGYAEITKIEASPEGELNENAAFIYSHLGLLESDGVEEQPAPVAKKAPEAPQPKPRKTSLIL